MISIRAFTDHVIKMSDEKHLFEPIDWNTVLADRGYVSVPSVRSSGHYTVRSGMQDWCNEHIGEEHYVWTGSNYWFETESDAIMFALRWGQDS